MKPEFKEDELNLYGLGSNNPIRMIKRLIIGIVCTVVMHAMHILYISRLMIRNIPNEVFPLKMLSINTEMNRHHKVYHCL